MSARITSESELINRYLAPLASGCAGALGLSDDCAVLRVPDGCDVVITTDAIAEGVHFLPGTAPEDMAWKALAVNVSDLCAKGAQPSNYQLAISFPVAPEHVFLQRLADGLRAAQAEFGMVLCGGDTDRRPGPVTLTVTALGLLPHGTAVRRSGARPGDLIFVTGTLGDAALGLGIARSGTVSGDDVITGDLRGHVLERYLRPRPRLAMAPVLRDYATAAMDISDGLTKDLGRLAEASGICAVIEIARLPLSAAVQHVLSREQSTLHLIVAGGDDYEILFCVSPDHRNDMEAAARARGIDVTCIGECMAGTGLRMLNCDGTPYQPSIRGWDHF